MLTAEQLGMTQEELAERIVERAAELLVREDTEFVAATRERIQQKVDESIEAIAAKHVIPNVESYVESFCLQETTTWGEKRGEPVTFTEYLVQRAHAYMLEKVDHDGKTKGEPRSSFWSGSQTRITHMIDKYLNYEISAAMKTALDTANSKIAEGIQETIRLKLGELTKALQVKVKVR